MFQVHDALRHAGASTERARKYVKTGELVMGVQQYEDAFDVYKKLSDFQSSRGRDALYDRHLTSLVLEAVPAILELVRQSFIISQVPKNGLIVICLWENSATDSRVHINSQGVQRSSSGLI